MQVHRPMIFCSHYGEGGQLASTLAVGPDGDRVGSGGTLALFLKKIYNIHMSPIRRG
jgi:hypothetical protein